jgi:hypothetical protein
VDEFLFVVRVDWEEVYLRAERCSSCARKDSDRDRSTGFRDGGAATMGAVAV